MILISLAFQKTNTNYVKKKNLNTDRCNGLIKIVDSKKKITN